MACGSDPALINDLLTQNIGVDKFTTVLGDGVTVKELCCNGKHRKLSHVNVAEWVARCVDVRLCEGETQLQAMRKGLGEVVPLSAFSLFSWQDLETLVCGSTDFDVSLLQSVTRYEGSTSQKLPYIQNFWKVLSEMNPTDKAQFLRFCWARTRVPARAADFHTKFKIQDPAPSSLADPDKNLPHAHTCFFSIQLPPYSTAEIMKERLSYAMWNCQSMNADMNLKDSELYNYMADDLA